MHYDPRPADLSNHDLLAEVKRLAANERQATVRLIAALAEFDARRLYLGEGASSLFVYCTRVLHLSEYAAYARIEAARTARKFPIVLALLADGALTLTTVGLLAPHLTPDNHHELLRAATHRSKREVEHLVAALRPQPPVPSVVRKLPQPRVRENEEAPRNCADSSALASFPCGDAADRAGAPQGSSMEPASAGQLPTDSSNRIASTTSPPTRPARFIEEPLSPERYKVQFTVSRETYDKLQRARDLLRHTIPNGDPAAIFDRALTELLDKLERQKLAAHTRSRTARPASKRSRHIPAHVRRAVWARDEGRCAFVGGNGRRCGEAGLLEFHHVVPYADGGEATVDNIQIRCRAHNGYEAERWFGGPPVVRERRAEYESAELGPDPVDLYR